MIKLTVMRIQEHSVQGEFGSNSFNYIEKVEHLLDRIVSLLSHTSINNVSKGKVYTCALGGCRH